MSAARCRAGIVRFGCYNFRLRCIGLGLPKWVRVLSRALPSPARSGILFFVGSAMLLYNLGCIWQNEPTKILMNQEIRKHRPASASG